MPRAAYVAFIVLTCHLSAPAPVTGAAGGPEQTSVPAAILTLADAVSRARTASPQRRATAVVAEGMRDAVRTAGRLPNPLFEVRTENWGSSSRPTAPDLDVFAVITQPFELGNKRTLRRQLAAAERDAALSAVTSVERDLALETVRTYIRALKARALVETLARYREGLTMLVANLGLRVEEGYSPEADLLKFKTEAARIDGDIARARLELERSLSALGIVIGAEVNITAAQLVEPAPLSVPAADPAIVAAGIARHPEVLATTAAIDRARRMTAIERARRLPDPVVTGGYKRTTGVNTLVFGVGIALPVFERNDSAVSRSLGLERGALAERDAIVHRLTRDAASVIRAAQTISDQAKRTRTELLEPAEEVRRAALVAFREGSTDILQLIDAERVYADVQRAAIDLRLDALLTTIEARFVLGEEAIP